MVKCPECGENITVNHDDRGFIAGCWSAAHEAPQVEGLQVQDDDVWPMTGNPCATAEDALESFKSFWH